MTHILRPKPEIARPYWDAALETQSRDQWRVLALSSLKRHLLPAYEGSPYYVRRSTPRASRAG